MNNKKYFLSYATANDDNYFAADCYNFINMVKYDPGVKNILLFRQSSAL